MKLIAERLSHVRSRVLSACEQCGREAEAVRLLAVSKHQPAEAIRTLVALGQHAFGENRLQEARQKQEALADLPIEWHFIGPVQSNKTRDLARHFDWVQSVDREKIVRRLGEQRPASLGPLQICLQVNIDREPQKAGVAPEAVASLATIVKDTPALRLRGLMCIPAQSDDTEQTRDSFRRMGALAKALTDDGHNIDTLSMGMSGDLELAIASGSTMVRIGTDLFGARAVNNPTGP